MLIKGRAFFFLLFIHFLLTQCSDALGKTIHIDPDGPADFNNIQSGIDAADDGDTVLVASGEYVITDPITFRGKAITIRSEAGPDETTIRMGAPSDIHRGGVVIFENGETVESVLQGFTITGGSGFWVSSISAYAGGGITFDASSGTVENCVIVQNKVEASGAGIMSWDSSSVILSNCTLTKNLSDSEEGAVFCGQNSSMTLANCTIMGNFASSECGAVLCWQNASVIITNSILWGNIAPQGGEVRVRNGGVITISYSDVTGGQMGAIIDSGGTINWGEGNIGVDPLFADPDNGDYHLKSEAGRWNPVGESWVMDDVTSPCLDAGDPNSPVAFEPFPNGGIVNMGAYGGTMEASKSPSGLHAKYGGGTGEPNNPYLIYTPDQMNTIGIHAGDWDKHFKLMADIDLSAYAGTDFNIIGCRLEIEDKSFTGVFDGNGHTISNFTYISTDVHRVSLFGYVEGQTVEIRDLGLINPNVSDTKGNYVGSLVGYLGSGSVRRCYVQGGSVSGGTSVGGLIAYNHKGTLVDCSSMVHVIGIKSVGGLVGDNSGEIIGCHTIGTVMGEDDAGGLAGFNDGTIRESSSTGDVFGEKNIGGLVGYSRFGTIQNSYSTGHVSGIQSVGGLVGRSRGDIMNCYASGSVAGGQYVGGLVGFLGGPIVDCYSTGDLIHEPIEGFGGNPRISGLVGSGHSPDDILASFWDIETSGWTVSFGGTGKTTTEMQTMGTFLEAGWDFMGETDNGNDDIWWMTEGRHYPRFWWELTNEN